MRQALAQAGPVLLEPVMKLEINTPEDFFGDVLADAHGRRGQVTDVEHRGKLQVIRALIPLAECFGYTTDLRSLTQGRATHSMEFEHYGKVPNDSAEKITAGRTRKPVRA